MDYSLGILKPDCLKRGLEKEVLSIIEASGLRIVKKRRILLTEQEVRIVWSTCVNEWFFPSMVEFMTSSDSIVFVVEGFSAIERLNDLVGRYDPTLAERNTIRYKYGIDKMENIIHSSLNKEEYVREYNLFFNQKP